MQNSDRYFVNPYSDYSYQLFDSSLLNSYLRKKAIECFYKNKISPDGAYCGGGLYTGNLGAIFMAYKLLSNNKLKDLETQIKKYMVNNLSANKKFHSSSPSYGSNNRDVSFMVGKAGYLLMGALVSRVVGNESDAQSYAKEYANLAYICQPVNFLTQGSDEIFVGRAGYLCGLLFLRKFLNIDPLSRNEIFKICDSIIISGKEFSKKNSSPCPLMYSYHGTQYLGAAHGLSGILQMLLSFPEYLRAFPEAEELTRKSVDYLLSLQKSNGSFPVTMEEILYYSSNSKQLVHWCHGAGGVIFLMAKAYLFWKDQKYLNSCIKCGELIWQNGLLKKGPGICHGVGGNGYAHLLLFRLTNDQKYLYRASKFGEFLLTDTFKNGARTPDKPFSLFEGLAGTVCFVTDLMNPYSAEYPLIPVF